MKEETKQVGAEVIFDESSLKILTTLLENPKITYNKTQLAEQSNVSRDALYRRFPTLKEKGIVIDSSAPGESSFYQLNTESELVNSIGKTLDELGVFTS